MSYTWNFGSQQGFVFGETSGSTNGYVGANGLHMDGGNSWGTAYWRVPVGDGVYAVDGQSYVKVTYHFPGNTFTGAKIWFKNGQESYASTSGGDQPTDTLTYTADSNDEGYGEVEYIGAECTIYNNGWYMPQIEIGGFTGFVEPGIYTSGVHLGDKSGSGIFTSGVAFSDKQRARLGGMAQQSAGPDLEWLSFWRFASTAYNGNVRKVIYSGCDVTIDAVYSFELLARDFDRYRGLGGSNDPFDLTLQSVNAGDVTFYGGDSNTVTFNNPGDIKTVTVTATRSSGRLQISFVCDINADIEIVSIAVNGVSPGIFVNGVHLG